MEKGENAVFLHFPDCLEKSFFLAVVKIGNRMVIGQGIILSSSMALLTSKFWTKFSFSAGVHFISIVLV